MDHILLDSERNAGGGDTFHLSNPPIVPVGSHQNRRGILRRGDGAGQDPLPHDQATVEDQGCGAAECGKREGRGEIGVRS